MKNLKYLFLSLLSVALVLTSCNKDAIEDEALALVEYLESAESPLMKDYVSTDMPAIISATDVYTMNQTGSVYIVDIRSADDFAAGHIENAVNVAAGAVLTHLEGTDLSGYEKVAIVCYSGQSAAWATCLCRISGMNKVFSMKWGMCSWNADFAGSWPANISNMYATQFTSDVTQMGPEGEMPVLETGLETEQEILEYQVDAVFAEGFGAAAIAKGDVFANPSNYYIVNYWPESQYLDPGHIPGAVQYTPKASMGVSQFLKTLPTDKTVVVYCYTGQTSANLAAYLRVLGYDAKSLTFGTNGMIYDVMAEKGMTIWSDSQIMGYDYVQ